MDRLASFAKHFFWLLFWFIFWPLLLFRPIRKVLRDRDAYWLLFGMWD
jgi:hypothetical protein